MKCLNLTLSPDQFDRLTPIRISACDNPGGLAWTSAMVLVHDFQKVLHCVLQVHVVKVNHVVGS